MPRVDELGSYVDYQSTNLQKNTSGQQPTGLRQGVSASAADDPAPSGFRRLPVEVRSEIAKHLSDDEVKHLLEVDPQLHQQFRPQYPFPVFKAKIPQFSPVLDQFRSRLNSLVEIYPRLEPLNQAEALQGLTEWIGKHHGGSFAWVQYTNDPEVQEHLWSLFAAVPTNMHRENPTMLSFLGLYQLRNDRQRLNEHFDKLINRIEDVTRPGYVSFGDRRKLMQHALNQVISLHPDDRLAGLQRINGIYKALVSQGAKVSLNWNTFMRDLNVRRRGTLNCYEGLIRDQFLREQVEQIRQKGPFPWS